MTINEKIENLWHDAHPLRGADQITFGAALEKYGMATVRQAMQRGRVAVCWTVMLTPVQAGDVNAYAGMAEGPEKERIKETARPYQHIDFAFGAARPEMRMEANGVQIG